jgi:hypothetical protein
MSRRPLLGFHAPDRYLEVAHLESRNCPDMGAVE